LSQVFQGNGDVIARLARPGGQAFGAFAATFTTRRLCMVTFPLESVTTSTGYISLFQRARHAAVNCSQLHEKKVNAGTITELIRDINFLNKSLEKEGRCEDKNGFISFFSLKYSHLLGIDISR
jgi:hypothetical protein